MGIFSPWLICPVPDMVRSSEIFRIWSCNIIKCKTVRQFVVSNTLLCGSFWPILVGACVIRLEIAPIWSLRLEIAPIWSLRLEIAPIWSLRIATACLKESVSASCTKALPLIQFTIHTEMLYDRDVAVSLQ